MRGGLGKGGGVGVVREEGEIRDKSGKGKREGERAEADRYFATKIWGFGALLGLFWGFWRGFWGPGWCLWGLI